MKVLRNLILIILSTLIVDNAYAQCENWTDSPQKETAENVEVKHKKAKTKYLTINLFSIFLICLAYFHPEVILLK